MRALTPLEIGVLEMVEPAVTDVGCAIVRVRISGMKRKRVQIMVERIVDGGCGIDDCERVSRAISALFDVHDPIPGEYDLEVSSPGVDRPLVRLDDFSRYVGHEAKLETTRMIDGRKRYRGEIVGVDGDGVVIALDAGEVRLAFADLMEARLVLTDKLLEQDLKRAAAEEKAARETS
jgi:ribosome maturation factor RimP